MKIPSLIQIKAAILRVLTLSTHCLIQLISQGKKRGKLESDCLFCCLGSAYTLLGMNKTVDKRQLCMRGSS